MQKRKEKHAFGRLELTFEGYGFVVPDQRGLPDVFVPAPYIGDALHKDIVEVTVQDGRRGKKEGRIVKVIERGVKQLVGRYEVRGKSGIVITDDLRVGRRINIPSKKNMGARHGEMVIVAITQYPMGDNPIIGEVIKRIGRRDNNQVELDILIARHQLGDQFPDEVIDEAKAATLKMDQPREAERKDLTQLPFVTIDGEDAKDFDDAVAATLMEDGSAHLWVSIADVSFFVEEGSKLDEEASLRGTSAYLPGTCIPMLPEDLSSDICSLLPEKERYSFTAEMVIGEDGWVKKSSFYRSVIRSRYRMTYTEANDYISNGKVGELSKDVQQSLDALVRAAFYIRNDRRRRGSIDFDLPEPAIVLDMTGKPENIVKADRNAAHMLIEDLMIAANEAVATYLTQKRYPCIYRVHDKPDSDKVAELILLMKYLGHRIKIPREPSSKQLSKIVHAVEGRPEERLINTMLLRTMSQAVYDTGNIGHFGLASTCYCHFTSPIRRYPDLLVHRLLADQLRLERFRGARAVKELKKEAEHSTKMERRAMDAEREAQRLYAAIFMQDKIGEVFDGLVSHTAKKGIFVELVDFFVEGLIEPDDLPDESFRFDPNKRSYVGKKTGKSFHIGDQMRVQVKDVSVEERRIFFEPA